MKKSRQIIVSLAIIASLLTAPIAVAQPHTPFLGGFDLISFVSNLVDEITSIFAPASYVIDHNGAPSEVNDPPQGLATGAEDSEPTNEIGPVPDHNG